ncbi:MAG TPA: CDP-glucose 4,6-dehydratase [Rhodocyclaceae bacterium]|nr:CDP-glucose 4,6-dehydratase [Rhodocyclaceae bacterium]
MENLVNPEFWRGRRVFITGHTGFKGSWLSLWLQALGAEVHGYALAPDTEPALFNVAHIARGMQSTLGDLRDLPALCAALHAARPEIVLHLAAQPLVPRSYAEPVETFAINALGTAHLLEAVRLQPGVQAVVVVSSDKCYENHESLWGHREDAPLGGHDPYSASKACTELIAAAYRRSFLTPRGVALATARAGNVIGGGDWTPTRLVPDILAAFAAGAAVTLRNPEAVRPWQHVLEPLAGYLLLAEKLVLDGLPWAEGWNFGPDDTDSRSVAWIVERLAAGWGDHARWRVADGPRIHETQALRLDCTKARRRLGWHPRWSAETAVDRSLAWYRAWRAGADMRRACLDEITAFGTRP